MCAVRLVLSVMASGDDHIDWGTADLHLGPPDLGHDLTRVGAPIEPSSVNCEAELAPSWTEIGGGDHDTIGVDLVAVRRAHRHGERGGGIEGKRGEGPVRPRL